jgi:hypothetical protein
VIYARGEYTFVPDTETKVPVGAGSSFIYTQPENSCGILGISGHPDGLNGNIVLEIPFEGHVADTTPHITRATTIAEKTKVFIYTNDT